MGARPKKTRVTLATVAEHASVSVTTVSVILSGRQELLKLYHPDTIEKVRQTAKRLGYRANLFATGLPVNRSPFFALVLQDLRKQPLGALHLWAHEGPLLAGVISAATERRLYPVAASILPDADEAAVHDISRIIDGGVCGAIVRTPNSLFERFLRSRLEEHRPLVVVFPRRLAAWPTNAIDVDNAAVGATAGHMMAERGRRRWVLVRYAKMSDGEQLRCRYFDRVARTIGATLETICLPMNIDEFTARDLLTSRLERLRPDGVYAAESTSSVGSLLACTEAGLRPAEDVDLIGCDCSTWQSANLPSITCVDISWEQVGMAAVLELAKMNETGTSRFDTVLLKPRIVAGGTCPVPAALETQTPQTDHQK